MSLRLYTDEVETILQWVGEHTAIPKDLNLVVSIHIGWITAIYQAPGYLMCSSALCETTNTHTQTQKHTQMNK